MQIEWNPSSEEENVFMGRNRTTGEPKWTATRVDLIFGSNSELRALAEVYACKDSSEKFLNDFIKAWDRVMNWIGSTWSHRKNVVSS
jgi:catalase-peroxidase